MRLNRLMSLLVLLPSFLAAQDSITGGQSESIVEKINRPESGKGSVSVIQDDKITEKIGRAEIKDLVAPVVSKESRYIQASGWRIQVFSGNNQRVSKNEAFSKEANLKTTFPELSTYVKYNAPFWRLRVGDFQTFQEAQGMLVQLRRAFPAFGREMSIVKEKIQVKVQ